MKYSRTYHLPFSEGLQKEGVVVRTRDSFDNNDFATHVAKFVRIGHVQTDEHWTRNWKRAILHYELLKMKGNG